MISSKKGKSFSQRVYDAVRRIPPGRVSTYKEVASAINSRAFRAVGNSLHRNPTLRIVPCHRVVNSDGSVGGFSLGKRKKILLLKNEGIRVEKGKIVDFEKVFIKIK